MAASVYSPPKMRCQSTEEKCSLAPALCATGNLCIHGQETNTSMTAIVLSARKVFINSVFDCKNLEIQKILKWECYECYDQGI